MQEPEYEVTGRGIDALEKILDMHDYEYTRPEITKGRDPHTPPFAYQFHAARRGFEPDMKLDDPKDPNTACMRGPHGAKFKATKKGWTFTSPAGETERGTGVDKLHKVIGDPYGPGTKPGKGVTYDQD